MTGLLLDTNILSEVRRRHPDAKVLAWWDAVPDHLLYVSVLTVGEIRYGVARLHERDPEAARAIGSWLDELVEFFADRLLEVDLSVAGRWGELRAARPLPVVDSLLAATAIEHGLTLVTRNTSDFEGVGVTLLDPFAA